MTDLNRALNDLFERPPHPDPVGAVLGRLRRRRRQQALVLAGTLPAMVAASAVLLSTGPSKQDRVVNGPSPSASFDPRLCADLRFSLNGEQFESRPIHDLSDRRIAMQTHGSNVVRVTAAHLAAGARLTEITAFLVDDIQVPATGGFSYGQVGKPVRAAASEKGDRAELVVGLVRRDGSAIAAGKYVLQIDVVLAGCPSGIGRSALQRVALTEDATGFAAPCADKRVRPSTIALACGDNGRRAIDLEWTTYGDDQAVARGTYVENDCLPTCLGGHLQRYEGVVFTFSAPRDGVFTRYEVSLPTDPARAFRQGYL